jgi:hypothetical protein
VEGGRGTREGWRCGGGRGAAERSSAARWRRLSGVCVCVCVCVCVRARARERLSVECVVSVWVREG